MGSRVCSIPGAMAAAAPAEQGELRFVVCLHAFRSIVGPQRDACSGPHTS